MFSFCPSSTTTRFILTLTLLYILAFAWYSFASARDPTSYFFNEQLDYEHRYSAQRLREARAYIAAAEEAELGFTRNSTTVPQLCIGVASVRRRNEQYLNTTIGSLLDGLSPSHRSQLRLHVLIAHTEPSLHPFSSSHWLRVSADRVLDYSSLASSEIEHLNANKIVNDYLHALQSCYATESQYILMLEDDTLAAKDWYSRLLDSLAAIRDHRSQERWVYLRLFLTSSLLGWNREEWRAYLAYSASIWSLTTTILFAATRRPGNRPDPLSRTSLVFVSCVFIPACIGLHFLAGRLTMHPLAPGVHQLDRFGCCSQALVYPREIVPELMEKANGTKDWLVDMMVEHIADDEGWIRYASVPSTVQHVGGTSSKGHGWDGVAGEIWNTAFEDGI